MSEPSDEDAGQGVTSTHARGDTEGAECWSCPFGHNGSPINPVRGIGPGDGKPAWIVVGEGSDHNEVRQGRPFVGESGGVLNKALALVGRDRNSLWLTQTTLCRASKNAEQKDHIVAGKACRPRLMRELASLPSVPILAVGPRAAMTLLPTTLVKISDLAGTYHRLDVDDTGRERVVVPTIHPQAILRGGGAVTGAHASELGFWSLTYDVMKVEATAQGRFKELDLSYIQTEVSNAARANKLVTDFYRQAIKVGKFALDLETYVDDPERHDARQPFMAKIRTLGLATDDMAISVTWRLLTPATLMFLKLLLASETVVKIGHNVIGYDRTVFKNQFYRYVCAGRWFDTLLAHHAVFPGMHHKLQGVACQFFGLPPWKSEHREEADTDQANAEYNARDVLATYALVAPLEHWLTKRGTRACYEMDLHSAHVAGDMHLKGVPVDGDINYELEHTFKKSIDEALIAIRAVVDQHRGQLWQRLALQQSTTKRKKDPEDIRERFTIRLAEIEKKHAKKPWVFSPNSGNQVIALLRTLGARLTKTTDKGRISQDAEVLEANKRIPVVADLLKYRGNATVYRTFVRSLYDDVNDKGDFVAGHVQPDGRFHSSWSVHKITGRWGADKPQAQNWPKGDPMGCKLCNAPMLCTGFDAYLHKPKKLKPGQEPCILTGTTLTRAQITFAGLPNLRAQVVAPPGKTFVGFDAAQIQARIIGLVSGDEWLCKVFADGKDLHSEFAVVVFPTFYEMPPEAAKKVRDLTKRVEYGSFFDGSAETLWESVVVHYPTVTIHDILRMIGMMNARMPRVTQWKAEMMEQAAKPPHEIRDFLLGRMRIFPLGMISPSEIIAFIIQAAEASIMCSGLKRVMPILKQKYVRPPGQEPAPILHVHDSLLFETMLADANEVAKDVEAAFTQQFTNPKTGVTVDFPMETKISTSWAEL